VGKFCDSQWVAPLGPLKSLAGDSMKRLRTPFVN
jgi:hypothetical protein